jgi:FkbM family methyltransferase
MSENNLIDIAGFNGLVQTKNGYLIFNKNDIYIGRGLQKYGEWSEGEVDLFEQLCATGSVVVEVGANIGAHTLALSKIVGDDGRVMAFEPQRLSFQILCGNMAINSIKNVDCLNCGLSSKNDELYIDEISPNTEYNFGSLSMNNKKAGVRTFVFELDHFFGLGKLDLLKIDVEGMEKEVINGAKSVIEKYKPFIYVENDRAENSKELIELIESLDYKLYWHFPYLINPEKIGDDESSIFYNKISANMVCFHKSSAVDMKSFEPVIDSADTWKDGFKRQQKNDRAIYAKQQLGIDLT